MIWYILEHQVWANSTVTYAMLSTHMDLNGLYLLDLGVTDNVRNGCIPSMWAKFLPADEARGYGAFALVPQIVSCEKCFFLLLFYLIIVFHSLFLFLLKQKLNFQLSSTLFE